MRYSSKKVSDTEGVPRPGNKIHIPLSENEAVRLLGKVKPTKDMPGPGASPTKAKIKRKKTRKLTSRIERATKLALYSHPS